MKSYLDDPEHEWEIDPEAVSKTLLEDIRFLVGWGSTNQAVEIVLLGYEGLRKRHPEATVQECFGTSMIWYFG